MPALMRKRSPPYCIVSTEEKRYFMECKMTAEEFAEELDREWAAVIHGASDKDIWIEEFDDE